MKKTVFTIAAGKDVYLKYACNLAMSFLFWNKNTDIEFVLITDLSAPVPAQLKEQIKVFSLPAKSIGDGFSSKLILDRFLSEGQNLFIDADCLIYGDLNPIFQVFKGKPVSVIGHTITEGLDVGFCKNVSYLLERLQLSYYPIFCGSIYYFEKSEKLGEFFNYIKTLLGQYDDLGLTRLRGKENEEPLIAIAMSKFEFQPVPDKGTVKADRMFFNYNRKNVLSGAAHLWNDDSIPSPEYSKLTVSYPVIIHYNNRFTENYEYNSDAMRLKLVVLNQWMKTPANLVVSLFFDYPVAILERMKFQLKSVLRPLAHKILGVRAVKTSNRV